MSRSRPRSLFVLVLALGGCKAWGTDPNGATAGGIDPHVGAVGGDGGVVGGAGGLAGKTCGECHSQDFARTTMPPHAANRFGMACGDCHRSEAVWNDVALPMHTAQFPLGGKHAAVACTACHGQSGATGSCVVCHQADFDRTTTPNHAANMFPTTCETCHTTAAWTPAGFDHARVQGQACVGCHQTHYDRTTAPSHAASMFPTTCDTCHTTAGWRPTMFDHSAIGAQTCVSCHQRNFDATTNPNHAQVMFPTACAECHTTTAWAPSTFNHTAFFPLVPGKHDVACTKCHSTPGDYAQFTCTSSGCHGQAVTDGHHTQVSGYAYTAAECYRCHRNGVSGG